MFPTIKHILEQYASRATSICELHILIMTLELAIKNISLTYLSSLSRFFQFLEQASKIECLFEN